jgi:hypothetical protein
MTALTILSPSAVPAHLQNREVSAINRALAGGGETGKRISTKGGVFRLYNDGKEVASIEDRHLDVVIVNAAPKVSRVFYAGQYVEGANVAPDCTSAAGDIPDKGVKNQQSANCATCPKNMKGSGQGDSRACRYNQHLAVVLANDVEGGDVMKLTLAATSIFGDADGDNMPLQAYVRAIMAVPNGGIERLVTRLRFDTKAPVPKLFFKPMRWLEEHEQIAADSKGASPEAIRAITQTVAQADGVGSAPAPAALAALAPAPVKPAKPTLVAAPVVEDDEPPATPAKPPKGKAVKPVAEVEDVEPVVRPAAAPAPTAVKAGGIAAALSEWDDE